MVLSMMINDQWSTMIDNWSLINDKWSMINDKWSLINDQWSMINQQWSMINDHWSSTGDKGQGTRDRDKGQGPGTGTRDRDKGQKLGKCPRMVRVGWKSIFPIFLMPVLPNLTSESLRTMCICCIAQFTIESGVCRGMVELCQASRLFDHPSCNLP